MSARQDQRLELIQGMKGQLMESLAVNETDFNHILDTETTNCTISFYYKTLTRGAFDYQQLMTPLLPCRKISCLEYLAIKLDLGNIIKKC